MVLVKARVKLSGARGSYSSTAFADTGARMTLIDRFLAEQAGVECTGRVTSSASASGHVLTASEAVVPEFVIEVLKYVAVAVNGLPKIADCCRKRYPSVRVATGIAGKRVLLTD